MNTQFELLEKIAYHSAFSAAGGAALGAATGAAAGGENRIRNALIGAGSGAALGFGGHHGVRAISGLGKKAIVNASVNPETDRTIGALMARAMRGADKNPQVLGPGVTKTIQEKKKPVVETLKERAKKPEKKTIETLKEKAIADPEEKDFDLIRKKLDEGARESSGQFIESPAYKKGYTIRHEGD